jgi:hypothetical protein
MPVRIEVRRVPRRLAELPGCGAGQGTKTG